MKIVLGRVTLLLMVAVLLFSAAKALADGRAPPGSAEPDVPSLLPEAAKDIDSDPTGTEPELIRRVTALSGRPTPGEPLDDPNHYWAVYVFTRSQEVRQLAAQQGLLGMLAEPGPLYAESELGFLAWVPEPLIPVLEQHPEVERLEWAVGKMPLVLIKDPPITDIITEEELAQRRAQS